jgi:hypothetical protein
VIRKRVAAESGSAEFLESNALQRPRAREARDIGCRDPSAARTQPGDAIVRVRDDALPVVRRRLLPEVESRMCQGHGSHSLSPRRLRRAPCRDVVRTATPALGCVPLLTDTICTPYRSVYGSKPNSRLCDGTRTFHRSRESCLSSSSLVGLRACWDPSPSW